MQIDFSNKLLLDSNENKLGWIKKFRIVCIIALVILHTIHTIEHQNNNVFYETVLNLIITFFKFPTLFLFIISGYLFELNFNKYQKQGFKKFFIHKFKRLLTPYLIFYFIPEFIYKIIIIPFFGQEKHAINFSSDIIPFFDNLMIFVFWFIPVLYLYFLINYFIKTRFIYLALLISIPALLFYSLNIYFDWINNSSHTFAIFGYLFFFFFGRLYCIKSIKFEVSPWMILLAFVLSFFEFTILDKNANTIKITNVSYTLLLFFFVKKRVHLINFPKYIENINYYFMYLLHTKVIYLFSLLLFVSGFNNYLNPTLSFISTITLIFLVLVSCVLVEKVVFRPRNIITKLFET